MEKKKEGLKVGRSERPRATWAAIGHDGTSLLGTTKMEAAALLLRCDTTHTRGKRPAFTFTQTKTQPKKQTAL